MNSSVLLLLALLCLAVAPARGAGVGRSVRSPWDLVGCMVPCGISYDTCGAGCFTSENVSDCVEACLDTLISCECSCKSKVGALKPSTAVTLSSGLLRTVEAPKSFKSTDSYNKKLACYNSLLPRIQDCKTKCTFSADSSCLTNCYEPVMSDLCRCGTSSLKAGGFLILVVALFNWFLKQGN